MKNMKCYGRQKTVVPKEKSFIKKFFDGNESSNFFAESLENEDEGASCNENKENVQRIFNSPVLFDEDLPPKPEKSFVMRNVAKPKQAAKNRVRYARGKNYVKKKGKWIQHLSTKVCKSLFDDFEKYDFTVEAAGKSKQLIVTEQQHNNSNRFKNIKQCEQILPHTSTTNNTKYEEAVASSSKNNASPKGIKNMKTRLYISSKESFESSGELFAEIFKCKRSMKRKNIKKKSLRKKLTDELSHNIVAEVEEKINQCMQTVDSLETLKMNISSNCKEKVSNDAAILSSDSALPEQEIISRKSSTVLPHEIIPKINDFYATIHKTSKNFKNHDSVSVSEIPNSCSSSEFFKSLKHKNISSKTNNFDSTQVPQQESPELVDICAEVYSNSSNDNLLSTKANDLHKDENLSQNMPKNSTLHNSHQETGSIKSLNLLAQNTTILYPGHSIETCGLTTENVSGKPICDYENDLNYINSNLFVEKKSKISISSADLPYQPQSFNKSPSMYLNKNIGSLNQKVKILKNSICNNDRSNSFLFSPNISNIIQSYSSFGRKLKRTTCLPLASTPVISRNRIHSFVNTETVTVSDDERISNSKMNSKQYESFCEKATGSKCLKTNQQKNSFINCLNRSASIEIQNSLHYEMTPNLYKSRKSMTDPNKSIIHPVSQKKNQSLLNISSINLEKEKSDDFTKAKLLELCDQVSVTPFADIYNWKDFKVKKIGEGTYGEVFMLSKCKKSSVLKIIAISEDPNEKSLQGLSSVYSEVKISKSLSELRCNQMNQSKNFVKIIKSSVVFGLYPTELMKAWDDFSKDRSTYNIRPDIYSEDQLFVILELEYGGKDMSNITLRNAVEAEIILKQIAVSLAVAEEEFSFEHRDLHIGNILVKRNRSKTVSYKIRGKDISFKCLGLQVTIIDFTLSLLSENNYVFFHDLADDSSLFDQTGDYHCGVYKSMRKHLENEWQVNSLYSNVLWLKYLCQIMKESKYSHPTGVTHKKGLKAIDSFNTQLMKCNCALECLEKCGITKTAFQRSITDTPRNSILVSRNSIRKSKLSICN